MSGRRILGACSAAALAACLAARAIPCHAAVVPLDMGALLDADVVINDGGPGGRDATQNPIDLGMLASDNFCFATATAAIALGGFTPDGLPDDAFFPAGAFHPDVRLAWSNADDGVNAHRIAATAGAFTLGVPPGAYSEVHLYATTGDGTSDLRVTLAYSDLPATSTLVTVPDWFDDPFATADLYPLIDGRDRVQVGSGPGIAFDYEESDDAAIFGLRFRADPAGTLTDVRVERLDATGVLNVFGAIAIEAPAGPALYESPRAPLLLDPANVVATPVASPLDWAPPPGPLLHYFVNDGSGTPALIFVSKGPLGLVFRF